MDDERELAVERHVRLDVPAEDVWAAVVDTEGWLSDAGALELREGAETLLTDGGVTRRATVDAIEVGRRLVYRWWGEGESAQDATRVEITVLPDAGATRVTVREAALRADASVPGSVGIRRVQSRVRCGVWWEARLTCLAVAAAPALVLA